LGAWKSAKQKTHIHVVRSKFAKGAQNVGSHKWARRFEEDVVKGKGRSAPGGSPDSAKSPAVERKMFVLPGGRGGRAVVVKIGGKA